MRCTLQSTQGISFVLAQGCPVAAGDSLNSPNLQIVITHYWDVVTSFLIPKSRNAVTLDFLAKSNNGLLATFWANAKAPCVSDVKFKTLAIGDLDSSIALDITSLDFKADNCGSTTKLLS